VAKLLDRFGLNIAALKPKNLDWRVLRDAMGGTRIAGWAVRFVLCDRWDVAGCRNRFGRELDELLKGWCRDVGGQ
jgi:hypothetical protein